MLWLSFLPLFDLLGFVGALPYIPPAAAAAATAGTILGGILAAGLRGKIYRSGKSWPNTRPKRFPNSAPDEGTVERAMPYQLRAEQDTYVPFTSHPYCVGPGIWTQGGLNVNPTVRVYDGIMGHRWKSAVTGVEYHCSVSGTPDLVEEGEVDTGLWIKNMKGEWSKAMGAKVFTKKKVGTFYTGSTYNNHIYRPKQINGFDIDYGFQPLPDHYRPQPLPPLISDPAPAVAPDVQPEWNPASPPYTRPAPPMTPTPDPPGGNPGPDNPVKPNPPVVRPLPPGAPGKPGTGGGGGGGGGGTGTKPGTGTGTGTGTGDAPTLRPDGVEPKPPAPIVPIPSWQEDFWGSAIGHPEARPQPSLEGLATETGKLEQKLRIMANPTRPLPGMPGGLGDLAQKLAELLGTIDQGGEYTLSSPCDTDENGAPMDPVVVPLAPSIGNFQNLVKRVDALAELIQAHKNLRQPICPTSPIFGKSSGEPVTVNFRSLVPPAGSRERLRKILSYRDQVGYPLEHHVEHWRNFRWEAGPVRTSLHGTPLGPVQVWASSEAEGRRVIEHAAAAAGYSIPPKAEWYSITARGGRLGREATMKVGLDPGGAPTVTKREGSSGLPFVVD